MDEPNDVAGTQGCVQMYHTGLWNDMRCSYSRNYICKRPVNEVCPEGWAAFNRRCYKYSDTAKTWNTSQAACMADGGGLAEITCSDVNVFLVTLTVGSTIADAWIGLRVVDDQHTWLPSGNVATYFNWAPGEPNNHHLRKTVLKCIKMGNGTIITVKTPDASFVKNCRLSFPMNKKCVANWT
ncbi:macrophage mannose receptor 1-like [Mercenaria mercenaria]|uniref:macrophage mannose receptor 1-like n=1 Tax=Mercenaria mercenaria TaxID=6596 RepID=UPI00234F7763|nr:macrophage mannose receptor 1-like [Mercenaria mercenaria]